MKFVLFVSLVLTLAFAACGQKAAATSPPAQASKVDQILGDWTGESKCVGSNPYCHDEVVVYHLARAEKDKTKINFKADKIVDGKPEFMGEFDMAFDEEKMTLTAEFTIPRTGGKGVWLFRISGDKMDGTLTVFPENQVGREIHVEKKKSK